MTFQDKYLQILNEVKEEVEQIKQEITSDISIQEPLKSKLFELMTAPSKHIRAVVSFLYLKAAGQNIDDRQVSLQTAVELVHNASLIHDDIIDESCERRSLKTINDEFENKLAVISGDYLLSIALKKICNLNSIKLIEMFAQTLDEMCKGEVTQYFNKFEIPSIEDYLKKTEQKTAKLFETAICGAILLTNSNSNPKEFAKNLGIAFQIRDDLINIKTTKSDLHEGIYTAPVIYSQNINKPDDGIEKTKLLLNNYIEKAEQSLENIDNNKYKLTLVELLELLKNE